MITSTTASDPSFAMSPVAAAAGGGARADGQDLLHDAAPKEDSITLEEAERLIRETAEKLWRGSASALQSLIDMLLNFFRWITRPFRETGAPNANVPTSRTSQTEAVSDVDNVMSPVGAADPGASQEDARAAQTSIPDDHLGDHFGTEDSSEEGGSPVSVPKLAFPKSFVARKPNGTLPLDGQTINGAMSRLQDHHPDAEAADPRELPITATICLLQEFVSKVMQAQAQVRDLEARISTHLVALAALGHTPADQLLPEVLASSHLGGLQGDEIRRLHAERFAHEQKADEFRGEIQNVLLNVKHQGLDVANIADRAKVGGALPDWLDRLERTATREPAAPTPAERLAMAIETDPEGEIASDGPSPERIASLKASLISTISNNEHEQERPRG